ncbi:galactose mutarotase-like enzyme [Neorhizobium galegae]|uniref:aldose 1-epimerase family protein n=1 Tax=Neorhizobium galegae TaxID=399 RepID=UPI0027837054|nr:aldose 1-epimerase family protein [Neorhizobium galegae]MDQ0138093.1 galactose mutarotase-like enzyme [Neorhizobium galegae]
MVVIKNESLQAEFTLWRAELVGLEDREGRRFVWDGNPDVWKGHAPILFPIVGMVPDDQVLINGKLYSLQQHGLAPRTDFELVYSDKSSCAFRFASSDETKASYPFDFCLDVSYSLEGKTLTMVATVSNHSSAAMPYSFGFHPGFCWPLPGAGARLDHYIEFQEEEHGPLRRPKDGLFDVLHYASPVSDRRIKLRDELFDDGAMMFTDVRSRGLRFGSDKGPSLDIRWKNLPDLGIWTKPGAGYLCVEPWQGYSAPVGFEGELSEKPGILALQPGEQRDFTMTVTVDYPHHTNIR